MQRRWKGPEVIKEYGQVKTYGAKQSHNIEIYRTYLAIMTAIMTKNFNKRKCSVASFRNI